MTDFCVFCEHYIGGGDWNLCCDVKRSAAEYPFGFLCYADTKACEMFKEDYRAKRAFVSGVRMCRAVLKNEMPPIKLGTVVYFPAEWKHSVESGAVSMLQQKADGSWKFRITHGSSVFDRKASDIGKKVFLTREEAEHRLKEVLNGDHNN